MLCLKSGSSGYPALVWCTARKQMLWDQCSAEYRSDGRHTGDNI